MLLRSAGRNFYLYFQFVNYVNGNPKLWKTAEIILAPKRSKIKSMNDLRPVALTPAIMKVFERFVLKLLLNEVKEQLDPLQFAYKAKRNVEDACLLFSNNILKHHLEKEP